MSDYFTAPDAVDEPTIWERTDGDPAVVVRRAELPGPHADLLWRVLTGVIATDNETVERVATVFHRVVWGKDLASEDPVERGVLLADVRFVLKALLEVSGEGR